MKRSNVVSLSLFILFAGFLLIGHLQGEAIAEGSAQYEQITLRIDGMTCSSCIKKVKKALLNVPGVKEADVTLEKKPWWDLWSAREGQAVVEFESEAVAVDQLIEVVERSSNAMYTYTASLMSK